MQEKNTHLLYGAAAGIGFILISVLLHVLHKDTSPMLGLVAYVPYLLAIILNANAYSKANEGFVAFGKLFWSCFRATMITTILLVGWTIVFVYAFPEVKEQALEQAREKMLANPGTTDEQVEMAINMTKKFYTTFAIGGALLGSLFMGALFSVIAAAVAPKKGERPIM